MYLAPGSKWQNGFEPFGCLVRDGQITVIELADESLAKVQEAEKEANGISTDGEGKGEARQHYEENGLVDKLAVRVGAGYGDPEKNRAVEQAAIDAVTEWFREEGWRVRSVEAEGRGYDLECSKGRGKRHVEVKGVAGSEQTFIITANEVRCAKRDPYFLLSVVTDALGDPLIIDYSGSEMLENFDLDPMQFRARLK